MTITREVPIGEFKARCLALVEEVKSTGEEIVLTKRGKPVAKVVPVETESWKDLIGGIVWQGDIVSPIDAEWEAER
ncbi:MAG: type II toxin-antitoxin system Phd/YefM family antitoxin [Dehalococcoidia bacterium]|nr:MAG: type II toxin-antitoxin system Phd/YefM family antitoxin [bacterium]MCE7929175.1 type II toxin-antitoxin system Phd/YefM family antitoxin [Chloroflexi bacterium CFX7]MCK6566017.1 type II toxin-antitoxin system Phd/YefM family antitoxin [Dehalococcoidia bacterium]MCL4232614.1 type II toxin-antitoxin system prevent-host-death family antitoxin [Dehalococcoidia bacterium]NUQ55571.1 type II toxin-antitoxin system Phd/YefM family antitoxin [Dehalococcoidia bacterium]